MAFRQQLGDKQPLVGSFLIEMPTRAAVEAFAMTGFDFLVLDLEHSAIDLDRLSLLIACCRSVSIGCIVRVEAGNLGSLTRVLDMQPDGLMIPGVSSVPEVREAVCLARFSPFGSRGLAPLVRHGVVDEGRLRELDVQTALIMQIEGAEAAEEAEAIASVAGIDAIFVGPYDLSHALRIPGELRHPALLELGAKIAKRVLPHVALGVYVSDAAAAADWQAMGASFFACSTDGQLFVQACQRARGGWGGASGR